MPRARANGIELEYETFGQPSARPLVLIMGLGAQMILWDEEFCAALAARDFFVVRFDNRDIGLSTHLDDAEVPNVWTAIQRSMTNQPVDAPYTLAEMADDTVYLMAALGLERAHVVGASMGGMIAQTLAIRHPERLLTLTSIMSTTGNPEVPPATPDAMRVLMTPVPPEREAYIERSVASWRVIGSPGFPFDEARIRRRAGRSFDRAFYPAGVARQLVAIIASGNRKEALRSVTTPTLVIHGDADPLARIEGGRDTAAAVPGAQLLIIEGMGHDLPRGAWPRIIDAIDAHASKVTPRAAGTPASRIASERTATAGSRGRRA
jgi:pimeloyl-ACP methyl ester carboxylesterase